MADRPTIVIIGGYGVFGGRLARRLIAETDAHVVVAGRSLAKAEAFCASHGGSPAVCDRNASASLKALFEAHRADIVIDAAGPFAFESAEASYSVPRAAIAAGAHYVDLADDADFVGNIALLNTEARAAGVTVLSGVSSVPALSSAVVDDLAQGMSVIERIDMAILPGNRAPRGLSVVRAILAQAGQPFNEWLDGAWRPTRCWGSVTRQNLAVASRPGLRGRWASPIRVPNTDLFPARYGAESVTFRAGLELGILHCGLWALTVLPRLGLVRSLAPLATPLWRIAQLFEPFGSDRGGMVVEVAGTDAQGNPARRRWTLIAEACDGPNVPATPGFIVARKLIDGGYAPGARPALGVFTRQEAEAALGAHAITCAVETLKPAAPQPALRTITLPAE